MEKTQQRRVFINKDNFLQDKHKRKDLPKIEGFKLNNLVRRNQTDRGRNKQTKYC